MQISKRRSDKLKPWDDSPIYLTQEGLNHLREQLERLKRALPELIAEAQRTAAYGDRSDNAEYKEAKSILRRTHSRVFSIQEQLKRVVIITPGSDGSGTVQLGSTVVLAIEDPGGATHKIFQILGSHETDPAKGRISNQSPLGAALMNHKQGETVTIETGSGPQTYRILEIR